MANTKKKTSPRDSTGRKKDELEKQNAEEQARRSSELAMATARAQKEAEEGVFDPATGRKLEGEEDHPRLSEETVDPAVDGEPLTESLTNQRKVDPRAGAHGSALKEEDRERLRTVSRTGPESPTSDEKDGPDLSAAEGVIDLNKHSGKGVPNTPASDASPTPPPPDETQSRDRDKVEKERRGSDKIRDSGVQVAQKSSEVVRVNEDISMTYGAGNHYDFEAGKKYRVPKAVAKHLEEKGLIWH